MKRVLLFALIASLPSCAVYDSKRGVLVTSSIQTIVLPQVVKGVVVEVPPFLFPNDSLSDKQTKSFISGGTFYQVSHTYVFDDVDRMYLRESLVSSLRASGADVRELRDATSQRDSGATRLQITFSRIGMAEKGLNSVCVFDALLSIDAASGSKAPTVIVEGPAKMTIASSKNEAIKEFVRKVAQEM